MMLRGTAIARQPVAERGDVGWARRQIVELAKRHAFSDSTVSRIEITVQEAARNIIKHAGRGMIVAQTIASEDDTQLDVLAIDNGPGMVDVERCLQDGYSSAGSMGTGLGALKRLCDHFAIFSQPQQGSIFLMRFLGRKPKQPAKPRELPEAVAGLLVPHPNEQVSGDGWSLQRMPDFTLAFLADGLGHGPDAARAVLAAQDCFQHMSQQDPRQPLPQMIDQMHHELRRTRGAAVALARINRGQRDVEFSSLGNVQGLIVDRSTSKHLLTSNGIVGVEKSRATAMSYGLNPNQAFIMATDGLQSRWQLPASHDFWHQDPMIVAAYLFKQFGRGRDDVGVLVFPPLA